jgi:hypothetical protein
VNNQNPLFSQRTTLVLLLGVLVGLGAGILTVLSGGALATGVLSGGAAFAAAVMFFHAIIG